MCVLYVTFLIFLIKKQRKQEEYEVADLDFTDLSQAVKPRWEKQMIWESARSEVLHFVSCLRQELRR